MIRSRQYLERVNSEIDRATSLYDFQDKKAYVYCDAAAKYASAKKDYLDLHFEACSRKGNYLRRKKFSREYDESVDRMRLMHKELLRTKYLNHRVITETNEGYESSFAKLDSKSDLPKFVSWFEEYAAWNKTDSNKDREVKKFDIGAVSSAIRKYTVENQRGGYYVTPMWIAPHMFKVYVNAWPASVKLKTHAAFQAMISANVPNATVRWGGSKVPELRLWDSGYVFYGKNVVNGLTTAICSLSFDASRQAFTLDAGTTTLLFKNLPCYANWRALRTWREAADWAAFHHSFLSQIAGDDIELDLAINICGAFSHMMSKTQAADIPKKRLTELLRAFEVGLGQ